MWASVNVPCSDEPRCPLVPKLTNWLGSLRSGRRSKYSRSSRATSTSSSFGAGLPARGEIVIGHSFLALGHRARLHVPNGGSVLGDGAIAGEFSGAGDV